MTNKNQKIIFIVLAILMLAWLGRGRIRNLFPPKMKFAAVQLISIDDKRTTSINALKDTVLIVSCYQTWCIDCARETPELHQLATAINNPRFKIIYISNEPVEKVTGFRQRFDSDKILFTQVSGSMGDLGIRAYPTTFLLNKKGSVIRTTQEGYDWLKDTAAIRKLLAE